jgi:hypothetical protein
VKFTFVNTLYRFDGLANGCLELYANNADEALRLLFLLVANPDQWRIQV